MKRYWLIAASLMLIGGFLAGDVLIARAAKRSDAAVSFHFADGASSEGELVDRFLVALEQRDLNAVTRLSVTRDEYLGIIVPGTVEPGQPLRQVSEQPREFFWRLLEQKNREFAQVLINNYGGRPYRRQELRFDRGVTDYATYRAMGETRVTVTGETGETEVIPTGWVAAVDGRYKFIGFQWNN